MQPTLGHNLLLRWWLVVVLLGISQVGCISTGSRAKWRSPVVAAPQGRFHFGHRIASPLLQQAEESYAVAHELEGDDDPACVDYYFQAAATIWPEIADQLQSEPVPTGRAYDVYHSSLTKLISAGWNFGRFDPHVGLMVQTVGGWLTIPTNYQGFPWRSEDFDFLTPVGTYKTEVIRRSYRCAGLGVPAVGVRHNQQYEAFFRGDQAFPVTVILRPRAGTDPRSFASFELSLYNPLDLPGAPVCGRQVPLEYDLSAPFAYLLQDVGRDFLTSFIQPGATASRVGLFMIEPYQRGKIPIVLIHGLLSDPFTWGNIANEIRARPELHQRYQIWGFEYPTGEPLLGSATMLRHQLQQVRAELDPTGSDCALSNVLMVGHSLGGLVTKLQITQGGDPMWFSVSKRLLQQIVTSPQIRHRLAASFYYKPSPLVTRTVFIATPHLGSPWANRPIGKLGAALAADEATTVEQHAQLIADNPGVFTKEFTRRNPTSIDLLRPSSPLLNALYDSPISPRVKMHSIIGRGYWMIGAGDSDYVVPITSAEFPGVQSQFVLKAKHTQIHQKDEAIEELLRIMRVHVREFDAECGPSLLPIHPKENAW